MSFGSRLGLIGSILLVCAPGVEAASTPAAARSGRLLIISGADGRTLERYNGAQKGDEFGAAVGFDALPMTARAANPWAVGAPGADGGGGRFFALDAGDGRRLWFVSGADLAGGPVERFGQAMVDLGHIDGDTPVHWAVGAPGSGADDGAPAAVLVVHASSGELVERLRIEGSASSRLGWTAIGSDDRPTGDSIVDHFVAGAPGESNRGKANAGAIHRFSSIDGSRTWMLLGKKKNQHLGYALAFQPDGDGDGVAELMVGAPGGGRTKGMVLIVSGASGRVLRRIKAPAGARLFGFAMLRVDVDGDDVRDLVVGAPASDGAAGEAAGALFAFSGVDRSLLWRREGDAPGQWFGSALVAGQDIDGDGLAELLVASLVRNPDKPRKDMVGGLDLISPGSGAVIFRVRGKRGDDRIGWPILGPVTDANGDGVNDFLVGSPRVDELYIPGES